MLTLRFKLIILAIYTIFVAGTTFYVHNKFLDAAKVKILTEQVKKSNKATNNVIKFNQDIRKLNVKDACFDAPLPADVNSLLK